jgi:trans-aconitate 2-methyltransferase
VRSTTLTPYAERLGGAFDAYLARYRQALGEVLPDERPFYFPFQRMLLWATRSR